MKGPQLNVAALLFAFKSVIKIIYSSTLGCRFSRTSLASKLVAEVGRVPLPSSILKILSISLF